jgi:hypothetical protein
MADYAYDSNPPYGPRSRRHRFGENRRNDQRGVEIEHQ